MKKIFAILLSLLLVFELIPFGSALAEEILETESLPTNMLSGYKSPSAKTITSDTDITVGGTYNAGTALSLAMQWGKADGSGNNGDSYSPINSGYYQLDFDVTVSEDINSNAKLFPQFHSNATIYGMKDLVGVYYEIDNPGNCLTAHNYINSTSSTVKPSADQSAELKAGEYRYTYVFSSPKDQYINNIVIIINEITSGAVKIENAKIFSLAETDFEAFYNQPNQLTRFMVEEDGNVFQRIYGYRAVGDTSTGTRRSLSSKIGSKYYDLYFKGGNTYTLNFDFRFPRGDVVLGDIKHTPLFDFYETRTLNYKNEYSQIKTLAESEDTDTKNYVVQEATANEDQILYQDNVNGYSYFYAAANQSTVSRRVNKGNIVNFTYSSSSKSNIYSTSLSVSAIGRDAKNDDDIKSNSDWLIGSYILSSPYGQSVADAFIIGLNKTNKYANATRYILSDTNDSESWVFQSDYNSYFASSTDNAYVALGIGYLYSGYVYDFDNFEIIGIFDEELPIEYENYNGESIDYNFSATNIATLCKNSDNNYTATLDYNSFDGVYIFKGWYEDDELISCDTEYTFTTDTVDTSSLTAKIISLNAIEGDPSFENYSGGGTLRVEPSNSNIVPYKDRWGIYNPFANRYGDSGYENGDWPFNIKAYSGTVDDSYKEYITDVETNKNVLSDYIPFTVTPYSGNTMLGACVKSRSIVRKLQNLTPDTEYMLSFYVNNPSYLDYLKTVTIADTYALPPHSTSSTTNQIYAYYVEGGNEKIDDLSKVRNWSKITLKFTTDSNIDEIYLHLSFTNKDTSTTASRVYIDNSICAPIIIENEGNSIRATTDKSPQALRYKFSKKNSNFESYMNMPVKEIGLIAIDDTYLGNDELILNGEYNVNGETKSPAIGIVNENNISLSEVESKSYFTAALYNIGRTDGGTNYEKYCTDFAVRPYLKLENTKNGEIVLYGNTVRASVFDVVQSIYTELKHQEDIAIADSILSVEEAKSYYKNRENKNTFFIYRDDVAESDYSFVYVGDTQVTTELFPEYLDYTYDWIVKNKDTKNIKYAISLGDLTQNSTNSEYAYVENGLKKVEAAGIYQSILRGNHDTINSFDKNITKDEYGSYLSGAYDDTLKNTYHILNVGTEKYLMLTLDYYPGSDVVDWAANIVENNADCRVIINTHGLLNYDMTLLTDSAVTYMHENLITKFQNIVMVVCGHHEADGPKYKIVTGQNGNKIVEMMINPQGIEKRNNEPYGFVATMHFSNNGKTVEVEYFSTVRNAYYKQEYQFIFELE